MEIKTFCCNPYCECTYVVEWGDKCLIVDPGMYTQKEEKQEEETRKAPVLSRNVRKSIFTKVGNLAMQEVKNFSISNQSNFNLFISGIDSKLFFYSILCYSLLWKLFFTKITTKATIILKNALNIFKRAYFAGSDRALPRSFSFTILFRGVIFDGRTCLLR